MTKHSRELFTTALCSFFLASLLVAISFVFLDRPFVKRRPQIRKLLGASSACAISLALYSDNDLAQEKRLIDQMDTSVSLLMPWQPSWQNTNHLALAADAHERGREIFLQIPFNDLYASCPDINFQASRCPAIKTRIYTTIDQALKTFPMATGLSPLQSLEALQDNTFMRILLNHLRKRHIFFFNTETVLGTRPEEGSPQTSIPIAQADMILNNLSYDAYIQNQFTKLLRLAKKRGYAIGLLNAKSKDLPVIKDQIATIKKHCALVPIRKILEEYQR